MKVFLGTSEKSAEHLLFEVIQNLKLLIQGNLEITLQASKSFSENLRKQSIEHDFLFDSELCAVMGFIEPLKRLPWLLKRRSDIKSWLKNQRPDLVITIDAPDFWLPICSYARSLKLYTTHIVSPSVWAWRPKRVLKVSQSVHELYCLFSFEPQWYKNQNLKTHFIGHPLVERYKKSYEQLNLLENNQGTQKNPVKKKNLTKQNDSLTLACLPGSREKEVQKHLPVFFQSIVESLEQIRSRTENSSSKNLIITIATTEQRQKQVENIVNPFCQKYDFLKVNYSQSLLHALEDAQLALCVSGTATLECALCATPTIVCYELSSWKKKILQYFIQTPYVALPNIINQKPLLPELILNLTEMKKEIKTILNLWLNNTKEYDKVKNNLENFQKKHFALCQDNHLLQALKKTLQQVSMKQAEDL